MRGREGGGFVKEGRNRDFKGRVVSRAFKESGRQEPMRVKMGPARKDRSKGGSTVNGGEG